MRSVQIKTDLRHDKQKDKIEYKKQKKAGTKENALSGKLTGLH